MPRKVIAMKHLPAIFLIGICCFLYACGDKAQKHNKDITVRHVRDVITVRHVAVEAHFNLGMVLELQGRAAEAKPHLDEVVRQEPDMAEIIRERVAQIKAR